MEYMELIKNNNIMVYLFGTIYAFINNKIEISQKFVLIYILSYILIAFNIANILYCITIINVSAFIYISYFSEDKIKNRILIKIKDKVIDYLYRVIFMYSMITFICSIVILHFSIIILNQGNICFFSMGSVISFCVLIKSLNNISAEKYLLFSFTEIIQRFDNIIRWKDFNEGDITLDKFEIVLNAEDKTFWIRDDKYNILNFKFLKYQINKIKLSKNNLEISKKKLKSCRFITFKDIIKFLKKKKILRGYSTIEMQLIRTTGIKYGYNCVFKRKIYEFVYSEIFFKNLLIHYKKLYLKPIYEKKYKEYLLYLYIFVAPIFINKNRYKNMLEYFEKENIEQLTKEEVEIAALALSGKKITKNRKYLK